MAPAALDLLFSLPFRIEHARGYDPRHDRRRRHRQVLFETIRGFYYPEASAMLIVMLVTASLIDVVSRQLRKLFL